MQIELSTLWAALLAYVIAGSVAVVAAILQRKPERTILGLLVLGLVLHTTAIALRWDRLGHGPFNSMHEILSSNVWSLLLIYTVVYWRVASIRVIAAVVMPLMFIMMGWLLMTEPADTTLPATYHTIWLYVHIGFAKLFLGATLVAVGLASVILMRSSGRAVFPRLPADDRLDDLAFRFMGIALVFESLMLIAGAIWAQDAWGRYWAWDPLETWSFITWLTLVFTLHARFAYRITPRRGAILILIVFVLAILTFFGVPFVSTTPHQGAV